MNVVRRPVIGVMGSSVDEHAARAEELGRWIAAHGCHLLTGGGTGVMTAVSRAFAGVSGRRGLAIGIIPCVEGDPTRPWPGYPNRWVELPLYTHLYLGGAHGVESMSRNHVNVLTADVIVVLPGGPGTSSESKLAVAYGVPCIAYVSDRRDVPDLAPEVSVATTFSEVEAFIRQALGDRLETTTATK
jgi:predicted Rossmann-fold nucleotide-binding protein